MTNKKYTDEDIISSLEVIATTCNCNECKIRSGKWGTCNCSETTGSMASTSMSYSQKRTGFGCPNAITKNGRGC